LRRVSRVSFEEGRKSMPFNIERVQKDFYFGIFYHIYEGPFQNKTSTSTGGGPKRVKFVQLYEKPV
jgi:hypothetical protein